MITLKRALIAMMILGAVALALPVRANAGEEMTFAWPVCVDSPEDAVTFIMAKRFADEIIRLSNNRLKAKVYPNAMLGGDRELLESVESGDIPFVVQTTAPQIDFVPETAIFNLPSAFADIPQLRATVSDPDFRKVFEDMYEAHGYKLLAVGDQGFRVMTTNKAVRSLEDFQGQKIRTMENVYHIAFWRAIGASPTPMNFGEVYIGLQQGTIDAQENPYETTVAAKLYEQQRYIVETNHVPHLLTLIASKRFYENLPDEDRAILDEAARIAAEFAYQQTDARLDGRIKIITDSGTEIIKIEPDLRQEIFEASQPVYTMIRQAVGDELVDAMLNARPER
ncbi:MAG: TRAP transporter substrate-binding protein [Planctomycetaceae bacterium]|nr:TRAP transporter substrate-binding protein [Planctomycetaceae bacterium]